MAGWHREGLGSGCLLALLALAACPGPQELSPVAEAAVAPAPEPEAEYVGRQVCATCHAQQEQLWRGSDHDRAMAEASAETVLGDFSGARFRHGRVTSTFFRRDGRYFVRTDGADGQLHDFPVAYTFGVEPLQQYLIEVEGGRLQALGIAWDSRPAADGGQRWFHLYGDEEVPAGDPLHWTGPRQNWNYMCAECHSTGVDKGYDAAANHYRTTWQEIDVSCEACHGQGSRHVAWAEGRAPSAADKGLVVQLKDPGRQWGMDVRRGTARRLAPPAAGGRELDTCGRCHSRRDVLAQPAASGGPLLDSHLPVLLEENLYYPDGQIRDEVYVYGSFLQSKMHRQGVTCSDCHEPHSLKLRAEGNALCASCHLASRFDTPEHHFHPMGSAGARCVSCHMPATTYMGVDPRRDHSLRIPRPDLSTKLGTPNACTVCHADRNPAWAAAQIAEHGGSDSLSRPHYGEVLQAGRLGSEGAAAALAQLARDAEVPGIARATALSLLRRGLTSAQLPAVQNALEDDDPLVRRAAVTALEALEPASRWPLAAPRLADSVLAVRLEAARVLAEGLPAQRTRDQEDALAPALAEYRQSLEVNADRPQAQLNLGWLCFQQGDLAGAEAAFRQALRLDPGFGPAYVNLAELRRLAGDDAAGEVVLRQGLARDPGDAALHHALGLLLVRRQRLPEALPALARAVELAPGEARYAYVYDVARRSASSR